MKKIFISYSHLDAAIKERFETHLGILHELNIWSDKKIQPGSDWENDIELALNSSDIAILLVSTDFLASSFIKNKEIPALLKRKKDHGLIIIPVIISPCLWKKVPWLSKLQCLPENEKPLSKNKITKEEACNHDESITSIVEKIDDMINDIEKNDNNFYKLKESGLYFINIFYEQKKYAARIYDYEKKDNSKKLNTFCFDKNSLILIKDKKIKLLDLLNNLLQKNIDNLNELDKRYQLDAGLFLYKQIFDNFKHDDKKLKISLSIIVPDHITALLPWHLLADDNQVFLNSMNYRISLASTKTIIDSKLSDNAKLMIVAPKVSNYHDTDVDNHIEKLELALSEKKYDMLKENKIIVVNDWDTFESELLAKQPDVIYYYGLCSGTIKDPCLLFTSKNKKKEITSQDFNNLLNKLTDLPKLVYINAIKHTGKLIKFAIDVSKKLSCLILSRYTYSNQIAQEQGTILLTKILTQAALPHEAVIKLYGEMPQNLNLSNDESRMMTPFIFCHYKNWDSKVYKTLSRDIHDSHWHLKIDRRDQSSVIYNMTKDMLKEKTPKSLSFIWYGKPGRGVDLFHRRLTVELKEDVPAYYKTCFHEIPVEWPMELEDHEMSFTEIMTYAFNVIELNEIPFAIRNLNQGISGRQSLVYLRFNPIKESKNPDIPRLINLKTIKQFLNWFNNKFMNHILPNQFILLGISFIVNNPEKFEKDLDNEEIEFLDLENTTIMILKKMVNLSKIDLVNFFKTHNINISPERKKTEIQRILKQTNGNYNKTVIELKKMVH